MNGDIVKSSGRYFRGNTLRPPISRIRVGCLEAFAELVKHSHRCTTKAAQIAAEHSYGAPSIGRVVHAVALALVVALVFGPARVRLATRRREDYNCSRTSRQRSDREIFLARRARAVC